MKRYYIIFLLCACSLCPVFSQNTIAKLMYEEAEEAFQKSDFQTTLTKLDEVEAILKSSNPKTQYLRILAQDQIVSKGDVINFDILDKLRKNCNDYLTKHSANNAVEDQYAMVYKISKRLKSYPATQAEYNAILDAKIAAEKYQQERPKVVFDSLSEAHKFKFGMTEDEFKAYNPEAAAILISPKQKKRLNRDSYKYTRKEKNVKGPESLEIENNIVRVYYYLIEEGDYYATTDAYKRYTYLLNNSFPVSGRISTKTEYTESTMYFLPGAKYSIHVCRYSNVKGLFLVFIAA